MGSVMTNTHDESLEKILASNLVRVIDFIKFAETKNAALLTFASAWTLGLANFALSRDRPMPPDFQACIFISLMLFLLSALTSITSFLPKIKLQAFHSAGSGGENLLFFGDISTVAPEEFEHVITQRYKPTKNDSITTVYMRDLCIQVSVNSQIAQRKFVLFNRAAGFVFGAMAMLLLPFLWRILAGGS